MRACVHACVRVCVRVCVCARAWRGESGGAYCALHGEQQFVIVHLACPVSIQILEDPKDVVLLPGYVRLEFSLVHLSDPRPPFSEVILRLLTPRSCEYVHCGRRAR